MAKSKLKDTNDLFRGIASGLRTAAVRPNINGYRPHEKQVLFHKNAAVKGRLFIGGNRSGKTVGGATEAVWWATGKHPYYPTPPPPVRGRVVSVDFLQGVEKIVRPEIARWLPPSELKGGSWELAYDKELRTLSLENGSFIEFMSYDQDLEKFAGTSRHFIWFDEEPPQDIFTECMARLIDTAGHWWITMTPVEGMTWIYDDVYEASKINSNIFVVEVDMTDNPVISTTEIASFAVGLSKDDIEARVHGRFVQRGGLIYKRFSEANVIDQFMPDRSWLHVASLDHGFNNPTAWLWSAIDPDGRIFVYDEHYQSGEVVSWHAARVHERNLAHDRVPDYYVGDPSIRNTDSITGTSVLIEYVELGIPILLGNNEVKAGINRTARYIEGLGGIPRLYIMRSCQHLLYEIQRYRWSTWANKKQDRDKNKKEEPHKKNDHACDSLRYLVASRPEMDNGTHIPEKSNSMGASEAVDPYDRVDEDLKQVHKKYENIDSTLGSEW